MPEGALWLETRASGRAWITLDPGLVVLSAEAPVAIARTRVATDVQLIVAKGHDAYVVVDTPWGPIAGHVRCGSTGKDKCTAPASGAGR